MNNDNESSSIPSRLGLRVGDWVVVRSRKEILSTLDENARLEELPFQPEMLAFCGKRMRVAKVAHKTCDNILKTGGRRLRNAVHLEGGRCDGAAHGNCQADCVFFWKESWLRRDGDREPVVASKGGCCTAVHVLRSARAPAGIDEDPVWICQATKLYDATTLLHWWDLRQYVRDVTSGNHGAGAMIRLLILNAYLAATRWGVGYRVLVRSFSAFQGLHGHREFPLGQGAIPDGSPTPTEVAGLAPGEWVEVRPQQEIIETITRNGFNRGLRYDMEMSMYSGRRYRVQMRVERLINESTGRMMTMKNPCIQLEDVYCRAHCTKWRVGCPRASNTYWREIWLKRVDGPVAPPREVDADSRRSH